jgi:uncharacterized protein (TIGR02599 family)
MERIILTRNNNLPGCTKGLTVIELLITLSLISIAFIVMARFITLSSNAYRGEAARMETQRDIRAILDLLVRNIHQAQTKTVVIDQLNQQPPHSRIRFTDVRGRSCVVYQQGNKLRFVMGNNETVLTHLLRCIMFYTPESFDYSVVSVSLSIETSAPNNRKTISLTAEKIRIMN